MPKTHTPPTKEVARRLERLERKMARKRLDAVLIETPVNRLYFTGFQSSRGLLVVQPGKTPLLLTDFCYIEMAKKQMPGVRAMLSSAPTAQMTGLAKRGKWRRVGYEGTVAAARPNTWREEMPDVEEWVDSSDLIADLRMVKSRSEQAALRRAVHLGDEAFRRTLEDARIGMTEWDVRRVLRGWIDRLDAQGESFNCIVSVGSNASKPHAHVTDRPLQRGKPLLIDMGVRLGEYCSDMTRTVFIGQPSAKMREIYKVTLSAQRKAVAAVRAGKTGSDIDAVARRTIEKAGYGKRFGHGTGHGVGLEIHEGPSLSPCGSTVLRPGMVVTVEPGIYLPGVGGVRIEDMVIVRREGCEVLTRSPKELQVLDI